MTACVSLLDSAASSRSLSACASVYSMADLPCRAVGPAGFNSDERGNGRIVGQGMIGRYIAQGKRSIADRIEALLHRMVGRIGVVARCRRLRIPAGGVQSQQ